MKTFVIAEVGVNHEGSLDKAKKLILAAKESDADAVKLQTYQTNLRVNKDNQFFDLFKKCETTYEEQREMKEYADSLGIEFFSTTFDKHSTKFLIEDLGVMRIKVASFDCSNTELLKDLNEYGKRFSGLKVILSVGMSSTTEIMTAVGCLSDVELTLLHCVSSYPTPPEQSNLLGIRTLKELTCGVLPVGYSDHSPDITIPSAAVLLGATTIEKHFTIDKGDSSIDNPVSADPKMFKEMVRLIREYESARGTGNLGLKEVEEFFTIFKRTS